MYKEHKKSTTGQFCSLVNFDHLLVSLAQRDKAVLYSVSPCVRHGINNWVCEGWHMSLMICNLITTSRTSTFIFQHRTNFLAVFFPSLRCSGRDVGHGVRWAAFDCGPLQRDFVSWPFLHHTVGEGVAENKWIDKQLFQGIVKIGCKMFNTSCLLTLQSGVWQAKPYFPHEHTWRPLDRKVQVHTASPPRHLCVNTCSESY